MFVVSSGRLFSVLGECDAIVQVALDLVDLWDALRIASLTPSEKGVILEVGTPLVKSVGLDSVRALRSIRGGAPIVVDTKTVDAADVEASLVAGAGGDAFTVLALAANETIALAVESSKQLGLAVYVDTINVVDLESRLEELSKLGVHIALVHVGLDVQRRLGLRATDMAGYVRRAVEVFKGPVAVAGGIKPREAGLMASMGARIIVIGSAIVRSSDPRGEVLKALESLREAGFKCR